MSALVPLLKEQRTLLQHELLSRAWFELRPRIHKRLHKKALVDSQIIAGPRLTALASLGHDVLGSFT